MSRFLWFAGETGVTRLGAGGPGKPLGSRSPEPEFDIDPPQWKVAMTEKNSGPEEGIKGVVEDVKGKAKETVGTVTGRDDMVREGKAQQDKAEAEREVAQKEAEAESARAGAKAAEKRQEANQ